MKSFSDDFDRAEPDSLGENWTQTYDDRGSGFMRSDGGNVAWVSPTLEHQSFTARIFPALDDQGLDIYGSLPNSKGETVGARITHDSTCTGCGKRTKAGDVLTAELAPNMGGTWHHTDCDDPKLEREDNR